MARGRVAVVTRTRPAVRAGAAGRSGCGREPPLDARGRTAPQSDRRAVNLRWLAASALAGLTGAGLVGAAIYVSLQGEATFAQLPSRAVLAPRPRPSEGGATVARRGDRLVRTPMIAAAKQTVRTPMAQRVGEREIIKVRPLVRIATGLSMTVGLQATDIPPFDPMRLFGGEPADRAPAADPVGDASDAEVSIVKRDLAEVAVGAQAPALTDADVAAQVEEDRRLAAEAGRRAALPIAPQLMLSRTLRPAAPAGPGLDAFGTDASPFKSIEVRVVPENVTTFGKVEARASETPLVQERDLTLQRGETLEGLLRTNGASDEQARALVASLGGRARAGTLAEGQQLRLQLGPGPRPVDPRPTASRQGDARPSDARQVTRVVLYGEAGIEAVAAMNDRGAYVSVAPPGDEAGQRRAAASADTEGEDGDDEGSGPRLYASLYETAVRHDLPRQAVDDLVRIFGYDVDFQRRIASGDSLELVYTYDEEASGGAERPDILSARLTLGGEPHRVYRFQSPDDGSVDYLDEQGRSLKKFLLRKPLAEGIMRSGFGYRRHPILGYAKLHSGVDWASPTGTPIVAAGNGTVLMADWSSGYGRRTEIQHANGYVTAYNRMSGFARGMTAGGRVRQGQVIGYVGSTGLSTGAHVHYEVILNGHFVDPMKIRMPRGRELDGRLMAEFKRQRGEIDALVQKAGGTAPAAERQAMR